MLLVTVFVMDGLTNFENLNLTAHVTSTSKITAQRRLVRTKAEGFRYNLVCLIADFKKVFIELLHAVEWAIRIYPYLVT